MIRPGITVLRPFFFALYSMASASATRRSMVEPGFISATPKLAVTLTVRSAFLISRRDILSLSLSASYLAFCRPVPGRMAMNSSPPYLARMSPLRIFPPTAAEISLST